MLERIFNGFNHVFERATAGYVHCSGALLRKSVVAIAREVRDLASRARARKLKPEEMSDFQARELARNIAMRIENELKYPGEIKVAVIRETRSIEFAR